MCPTDPSRQPANDSQASDLAADWFARMHSGEASLEDQQAFEAWLQQDPVHGRQYRNLDFLWNATLGIPEDKLRSLMAPARPASAPGFRTRMPTPRRWFMGLAGGCALALIGAAGFSFLHDPVLYQTDLATAPRERRQELLPDGSLLELNTATQLTVRLRDKRREVTLHQGEALFTVAADSQQPFIVDAGLGSVLVTGTRFDVRREPELVQVVVDSGTVTVRGSRWWDAQTQDLHAGQGVQLGIDRNPGAPYAVNVSNALAWQRGKIIFENQPLGQAIREVNRYLARPLQLESESLAQYRIAGVFDVDRPESILDALPRIAPVEILQPPHGPILLRAR